MYANLTDMSFKSSTDLQQATEKLSELLAELQQVPGFQAFYAVRVGDQKAVMIGVYASQVEADAGRTQMASRVAGAAGPHLAGPPQRSGGQVLTHG